ncbi:MAG: EamA family transporter [Bacteroidetes bacterium]|nr:MAG: EamA family transporter [Bacteroidota bacterium]
MLLSKRTYNAQLRLHFVVFLWGFTAILGDIISVDSIPLVTYRMLIAVISIYAFLKFKGVNVAVSGPLRWKLYGAGMIIALHWITFFHAIKISTVSVTLACIGSGTLFVSILEPLFFRRKIALSEVLLGIAVAAGIFTIANAETSYINGVIIALISAFLSALFSVMNGMLVKKSNSAVITVHELFGGWLAIALLMIAQLAFGERSVESISLTAKDVGLLIVLGTIATAYAFIESVAVMKELSPFTVVLTINLEPVYGILLAYFLLGDDEKMSPEFYFGALIILASVLINGYLKRKQRRRSQETS